MVMPFPQEQIVLCMCNCRYGSRLEWPYLANLTLVFREFTLIVSLHGVVISNHIGTELVCLELHHYGCQAWHQ